ncbi:conserved unknown protein [Ectocarpus siliculosus]|uniref:Uncharacterized protein n=1 Tax=Ectocarpus siliculosus TaxID=2880 RepID=D7G877_ECTSI|nr:conserved unknown protein [Ectocarpus siliculosus]|eukprot:CBJ27940.1 conserved unknown protein [Ectocarpus siliculosus]
MRVPLNSGTWTDEEHKGFLRGLEVYGHGNWNAMAVFVLSRSPPQIEAYAQDYMAEKETAHDLQQVALVYTSFPRQASTSASRL